MAERIRGTEGLHECDFDKRFNATYVGQAHIAGTGPKGKTCRQCKFWHDTDKNGKRVSPGYRANNGALKDARCHAPIPGKAAKAFPHSAMSCMMFEEANNPFLPQQDAKGKGRK